MLYYKVLPQADQKRRSDGSFLVGGELYTENEVKQYKINPAFLIPVEVSKKKVGRIFGARMQVG